MAVSNPCMQGSGSGGNGDRFAALERLVEGAQKHRSSGSSQAIRRLLLGLHNGRAWPFDMGLLRRLDGRNMADALAVLEYCARPFAPEVSTVLENGDEIMEEFAEVERDQGV